MKKQLALIFALSCLASGCVVYDGPYRDRGEHRGNQDGGPYRSGHDHDHDGIPDRQDRNPNNSERR